MSDNKAMTGLIALIAAVSLFVGVGLLVLLVGGSPSDRAAGPKAATPGKHPYPECEMILDYVQRNTGRIEGFEVVSWERHEMTQADMRSTGKKFRAAYGVTLRYRATNQLRGRPDVYVQWFRILDGRIDEVADRFVSE